MVSGAEPEYCKMHLALIGQTLIGHVVITSLLQAPAAQGPAAQGPAASVKILRDQQEILAQTSRTHAAAIRGNGSDTTAHGRSTTTWTLALQVRSVMAHFDGGLGQ
jgi:hypothetical protein